MRLARRALVAALATLMLCAAASAQALRPETDPRNLSPAVGTGGPVAGPTGLFTIYDGQTLRRGEFTFSIAYSNFDRDPGVFELNEARRDFGFFGRLELYSRRTAWHGNMANAAQNLPDYHLPSSQLNFPALEIGTGIVVAPPGPNISAVSHTAFSRLFVRYPFVGGSAWTSGLSPAVAHTAASSPRIGMNYGFTLPGVLRATTSLPFIHGSTAPAAPFINNKQWGDSSLTSFSVPITDWSFVRPRNSLDVRGNRLWRGASPAGATGDFGTAPYMGGRLDPTINTSANLGYIHNTAPVGMFPPSDLLDRPNEFLGGSAFSVNKHIRPVLELRSTQYVGVRTPYAFENGPWGIFGPAQHEQFNQQRPQVLVNSDQSTGVFISARGIMFAPETHVLSTTADTAESPRSFAERDDVNGFFAQFFIGRRSSRTPEFLPNQPPSAVLRASSGTITLPCQAGTISTSCNQTGDQMIQLSVTAIDSDGDTLLYTYTTTGGRVTGDGANVTWDLSGVQPGTYTATVTVDDGCGGVASSLVAVTAAECAACVRVTESTVQELIASADRARLKGTASDLKVSIYQNTQALSYLKKGDRATEAAVRQNLAEANYSLGEYQQAIKHNDEALSLARAAADSQLEIKSLIIMGKIYDGLGEHPKAVDYLKQALHMTRRTGNGRSQAVSLLNLGHVYFNQRNVDDSLEYYRLSIPLFKTSGDREGESLARIGEGKIYAFLKEYEKSIECYNAARALLESENGKSPRLADIQLELGRAIRGFGTYHKALGFYDEALASYRRSGNRNGEAESLYEMALVMRDLGKLSQARTQIETTLEIVDSLRSDVPISDLRSTFFASAQKYYSFYIDLLVSLQAQDPENDYYALALEASERARGRWLFELLRGAQVDLRQGIDPELIEKERSLQQELNAKAAIQTRLLSNQHTKGEGDELANEIKTLTEKYQLVQAAIRAQSPQYASLTQPQQYSANEIKEQVLDNETLLLEYLLGDERSFLFVASSDSIVVYILPKRAEIESAARETFQLLASLKQRVAGSPREGRGGPDASAESTFEKASRRLSQILLGPAADRLGTKRLLVVAPGMLQRVPFGALPIPESVPAKSPEYRPLIVEHEIVYVPSASTILALRRETAGRKPAPESVAVFADPVFDSKDERITAGRTHVSVTNSGGKGEGQASRSLPRLLGSRWEADQIASLVGPSKSMLAIDFKASRDEALSQELRRYRFVHFATHAFLDEKNPELSAIALSLFDKQGRAQNGFLRSNEIYNMKLSAEMVVLSGCLTGRGKEVDGEIPNGLTRGFMYAGAPRVVYSLWSVDDQATADLMVKFYRKMLKEKLRPAAALRAAQIEMRKDRRWKSPYFWAAFMFQGEWRAIGT